MDSRALAGRADADYFAGTGAPVNGSGGPVILSFTASPAARYEGESAELAWTVATDQVAGALVVEILAPGGAIAHTSPVASGSFTVTIGDTGGITGRSMRRD